MPDIQDLFIIGGGVNGAGIARDAAGRGLCVTLAEMGDLGGATSSASTKLFHGGLRYLEYYEFSLVRAALKERETLLRMMPHISWPMRFVLPHHKGLRPRWLLRLGLFLYDHLGGRKILPATRVLNLRQHSAGDALKADFKAGFEYSDCWVQDSRLTVLNAVDAAKYGAKILPRHQVMGAKRHKDHWEITVKNLATGRNKTHRAKQLINAGGPWVADIVASVLRINTPERVRLVRGSHIVVKKQFEHDQPYILQGGDGRIVFAIPYEQDFTLIGTTDCDHDDVEHKPVCTDDEAQYLCDFVNDYFQAQLSLDDIIWRYSGVRPLYDDGASAAKDATRDYVLSLDDAGAPLLNIFGGKITTYRYLAESALDKLGYDGAWTANSTLPGGDFRWDGAVALIEKLQQDYPYLTPAWAERLIRHYGTCAWDWLGDAKTPEGLGHDFGATLTQREVDWLRDHEFAQTGDDVVWRRTKLGLRLSTEQIQAVDAYIQRE